MTETGAEADIAIVPRLMPLVGPAAQNWPVRYRPNRRRSEMRRLSTVQLQFRRNLQRTLLTVSIQIAFAAQPIDLGLTFLQIVFARCDIRII